MGVEDPLSNYEYLTSRTDLTPGTILKIGSLLEIDEFIRHIARVMSDENNPEIKVLKLRSPVNIAVSEIIDEGKYGKKFFGELRESTVLILPADISWLSRTALNHLDLEQPTAVNFLVATEMHASFPDRSIGKLVNEILLCECKDIATQLYVRVRPACASQVFANIETYINTVNGRNVESFRQGLKYIYPAGLPAPSFGRNR